MTNTASFREHDGDARGLDPFETVAAQQARVERVLDEGRPEPSREAVRSYLDVEDRIIFDTAERIAPELDDEVATARTKRAEVLRHLDHGASVPSVRALFDRHVEETEGLFRALWSHLDAAGRDDVAGALEEARLSREEADVDVPARPANGTPPA
jgi:hypothetical protein